MKKFIESLWQCPWCPKTVLLWPKHAIRTCPSCGRLSKP